jgi:DNA adenine methylase
VLSRQAIDAWRERLRLAKPFLKWAGGKQQFLYQFAQQIPPFEGSYIEPFLGSGAVFFKVISSKQRLAEARLGDTNKQLVQCFIAVQSDPEGVYERLEQLQHGIEAARDQADFYYQQRDIYNAMLPKPDPALFIFLNRACWNGLYRVNLAGRFNVPFGAHKGGVFIPSLDDLLNASAALQQARLRTTPWQNTIAFAKPGDFVFLDPPYFSELVINERDKRRGGKYHRRVFDLREHHQLAQALSQLASRSVDFMLTNSAEPEMVELYESFKLNVSVISIPRAINSKTDKRGAVNELLVTPPGAGYGVVQESLPGVYEEDVADLPPDD